MTDRPIIFSAPMVRAILEGRKTQTRRVAKLNASGRVARGGKNWHCGDPKAWEASPYGAPGDRLWVRETWKGPFFAEDEAEDVNDLSVFEIPDRCEYKADGGPTPEYIDADDNLVCKWRPSIYMPRWASRITLGITGVRVERLQGISADDADAEGIDNLMCAAAVGRAPNRHHLLPAEIHGYAHLWEQIHGPGSWDANPWVWVVEFMRVTP